MLESSDLVTFSMAFDSGYRSSIAETDVDDCNAAGVPLLYAILAEGLTFISAIGIFGSSTRVYSPIT